MNPDVIIIGAGLSGSVIARKLAEDGKRILMIERRPTIGGNLFDERLDNGILVQRYGPHTFHANDPKVIEFVKRFATFEDYRLKCMALLDDTLTPSPFNFETIDQFYDKETGERLKGKLLQDYPDKKATVLELLQHKDDEIRGFAQLLFNKDYSLYTSKQWGIGPEEVDPSVLRRVPVEFSYRDEYFRDLFQGVPAGGFTGFIASMLDHPLIEVRVGIDALEHLKIEDDKILYDGIEATLIYSGEVDRLFGYCYGRLPYRSLRFEYEEHEGSYQPVAIVAYPSHDYGFTRITEYTKLPYQESKKTIIVKEYSLMYDGTNEPYYPIPTEASDKQYAQYEAKAKGIKNLLLLGRLAQFKYLNMDQAIARALDLYERMK